MEQLSQLKTFYPSGSDVKSAAPILEELDHADIGLATLREALFRLKDRLMPVSQPEETGATPSIGKALVAQPRSVVAVRLGSFNESLCDMTAAVNRMNDLLDC